MKPFFSLVIPCYNDGRYAPGQYIDRLLSNILEQGLNKGDIEVIISDDNSKIPYDGTLERYKDKLNIKVVKTDYNFAPGNTRQKGVEVATGEWLCFADHDDMFYKGALAGVKQLIEQKNEKYIVYSDFNKVEEGNFTHVIEKFEHPKLGTWIHGKFYNLANFWRPYNIHFKKDLKTHEDLYLGKLVECALNKLNIKPYYIKSPTYMWVHRQDSVSHGNYTNIVDSEGYEHTFLESHFEDYLTSQITSVLDAYQSDLVTRNDAIATTLSSLAVAYMSVCGIKAKNKKHYMKSVEGYSAKFFNDIKKVLDLSIASVKVILSTSLRELSDRILIFTDKYKQPKFIDWLTYLDSLDYLSIIDKEKADINRQNNKKAAESKKLPTRKSKKSSKQHRPFFSIIIPCYNDGRYKEGNYLDKLLDSLTKQQIDKKDLEVICSDDCSPVPFESIMSKYENDMIIKYIRTDYNFAPGNTRAKGLTIATGEWLAFADHDDTYYPGALKAIRNAIKEKDEKHFAFGDFNGVNEKGEVVRKFENNLNWCHAKFYNKDNLWDKYGIHFIKDLKSHEDIAICSQVSGVLSTEIPSYTYLHSPIYAWTDNPQSVSHAKYTVDTESGPREFLEVFFGDYLTATGYIYLDQFSKHSIKITTAIKWCLEIICYCYFYLQGFQFRRPEDFYKKNFDLASDYIAICKKTFNLTNETIYKAVSADNASMYYRIYNLANPGSGRYIPTQTFKQWLELVSPVDPEIK